ncbi:MAG TPA: hypothetical protein DEP66_04175, partial [Acidimicrobiaceae bacterium]|nr:hypothetical protein [Acidimicrobiaceae bacterium]
RDGAGDAAGGAGGPTRAGTLEVLLAADPTPTTGWTPWDDVCAWACRNVVDHVLETLTVVLPDGTVEPWLAESVAHDVSLTRWTVELRAGLAFTDGRPVTAPTVKEGFDLYLKSGDASRGHVRDARLVTVQAPDDTTLVFELSEPNAGFPATLAGPVGRVFSVEAARINPESFAGAPVGTGPFVFDEWRPGRPVVLRANADYWRADADGRPLPFTERIRFTEVPDETARLDRLRAGRAHVMQTRVPSTIAAARSAGGVGVLTVVDHLDDNVGAIVFNTLRAPFDDVRVRRGLALAVDQSELLVALGSDGGAESRPATQWWSPESVWHSGAVAEAWPSNSPDAAAALLGEYTADPERSDGRAVGALVRVRIQCTDDPSLSAMVDELGRQLRATGLVEVVPEVVSRTGLIQRVTGSVADSPSFAGDFTATCWRLGGESDPWVLLESGLGPVRTSPLNVSNLYNDDLAALVDLVQGTVTTAARKSAVTRIMLAFAAEVPAVYLGYAPSAIVALPSVVGVGEWTLPTGRTVSGQRLGVGRFEQVWVPVEQ